MWKVILFLLFIICFFPNGVSASYFPDPTPTAEWDLIGGQIFGGSFPIGSEIAAWDAGGTLRFHATVDTLGNFFGLAAFYGPPTGSTDPGDFTWKIFDGMNIYSATVHAVGTTWNNYVGDFGTYIINFDRGDILGSVPEPSTLLILGLVGLMGLGAKWRGKNK